MENLCKRIVPPTGKLTPQQKAQRAWDNGHVPNFLLALCELLMCSDPWPASKESETVLKSKADTMSRNLGFDDWIEAYHGLVYYGNSLAGKDGDK